VFKNLADDQNCSVGEFFVKNLVSYQYAAGKTEGARDILMSLVRDDDKCVLVFTAEGYERRIESATQFLKEMRRCERNCLDFYVETEEDAIMARNMQRYKQMEERGGSEEDKYKGRKWIPPPECRRV
jgi:KaiC/GvpD/RAD55 family RecA-like ATPase